MLRNHVLYALKDFLFYHLHLIRVAQFISICGLFLEHFLHPSELGPDEIAQMREKKLVLVERW